MTIRHTAGSGNLQDDPEHDQTGGTRSEHRHAARSTASRLDNPRRIQTARFSGTDPERNQTGGTGSEHRHAVRATASRLDQ